MNWDPMILLADACVVILSGIRDYATFDDGDGDDAFVGYLTLKCVDESDRGSDHGRLWGEEQSRRDLVARFVWVLVEGGARRGRCNEIVNGHDHAHHNRMRMATSRLCLSADLWYVDRQNR
jgi:hypothetical protein